MVSNKNATLNWRAVQFTLNVIYLLITAQFF